MYKNSWKNFDIDISKNGFMCKFGLRRAKPRFSVKKSSIQKFYNRRRNRKHLANKTTLTVLVVQPFKPFPALILKSRNLGSTAFSECV